MSDRPAGKKTESSAGVDHVIDPPADEAEDEDCVDERPDDAPREETVGDETVGEETVDDECRVPDDVLDARERRQSTVRKPSGPSDSRVDAADVVIEPSQVPPAPPTAPA